MLNRLKKELSALANLEKSKAMSRFFKTGKCQYGEGDIFLGLTVPEQRIIAKKFRNSGLYILLGKIQNLYKYSRIPKRAKNYNNYTEVYSKNG